MSYNADPYTGAQYLYQGIASAGQSLSKGAGAMLKRYLDEQAIKKFLGDIAPPPPDQPPGGSGGFGNYARPFMDRPPITAPPIRFQDGGYTGEGEDDEPAGVVHKNEYVVPSPQVEAAGGPGGIQAMLSSLARNPRAASAPGFGSILGLMEMGEKQKEQQKQLATTGKAIKQILKANPDLAGQAGLMPEHIENMGSRDALAVFNEVTRAQAMKATQAKIQDYLTQSQMQGELGRFGESVGRGLRPRDLSEVNIADYADANGSPTSAPPQMRAALGNIGDYYEADAGQWPASRRPNTMVQPAFSEALRAAMTQHGRAMASPQFDNSVRGLAAMYEQADGGKMEFDEDPITGARFARRGNTVQPSGMNPAKTRPEIQTIYDESGQPYRVVTDPRTGRTSFAPRGQSDETKKKLSVEAIVEAEKALQQLDIQIENHQFATEKAKTDPKRAKPDPAQLVELQRRRKKLSSVLSDEDETPAKETSTPPPTEGPTPETARKAEGIRSQFRAGKVSKEEAVKQLKALGYK